MLCILAKIDEAARTELLRLQEVTKKFGLEPAPVHGHVTLACYTGKNEEEFIRSCRIKTSGLRRFRILYEGIEVFAASSVIAAAPGREKKIEEVHGDISSDWSDDLNSWTRDKVWLPHTTLLQNPDADLERIAESMREIFRPFSATVTELEFSKVNENGYEIIDSIMLP